MAIVTASVMNIQSGESQEFTFTVDADDWRGMGDGGKEKEIMGQLEVSIEHTHYDCSELEDEEEEYNSDSKLEDE